MIRINLLPRDELPKERAIKLPNVGAFAPVVLVAIAIAGLAVTATIQGREIDGLQTVIAEEEAESRRLAPEIAKIKRLNKQRADLNDRLDVIVRLDSDRYFRVHLLDELNRSMPEHMWLTRFEDIGGDRYTIEGVTFSNFLVSDLLQNMARSPYFTGVNLTVAEKGLINDVAVVKFQAETTAHRNTESAPYGS